MSESTSPQHQQQVQPEPEPMVLCKGCGHPITRAGWATEVLGKREHTFRNPAGYSFHIACYQQIPGCLVVGEPTSGASWFPGYNWCFAHCQGCQVHLGWWYSSPQGFFSGLIVPRLLRP